MDTTKFPWLEGRMTTSHRMKRRVADSLPWMKLLLVASTTVGVACLTVYNVMKDTNYEYLTIWTGAILAVWIITYDGMMDGVIRRVAKVLKLGGTTNEENVGEPTKHFETATIANNLIPYLERFMAVGRAPERCTLVITGNDCHPVTKANHPWREFLHATLKEGHCRVIQYISEGKHDAESILEVLQREFPNHFEYRCLANPAVVHDPADRELIETLRTFHPTLAWRGDGGENDDKLMWIENHHPPGSTEAYGCDYYNSDALRERHEEFDFYREKLEHAWAVSRSSNAAPQAGAC